MVKFTYNLSSEILKFSPDHIISMNKKKGVLYD